MKRLSFASMGRLLVLAGVLGSWSGQSLGQDRTEPPTAPPAATAASGGDAAAADAKQGKGSPCVKPAYPPSSLRAEHQGVVTMSFLVNVEGRVVDSRIVKSSGHALLDTTAVEALSLCRFRPKIVDGKPVEAWTNVQYRWTLI